MKSVSRLLRKQIDNLYDVANVSTGFQYWFYKLLGFCISIFEYENLPGSIPSRELELLFILQGYATPFYWQGEPVAIPTHIYDFDIYYTPTTGTFGNPLIPYKRLYFQNNKNHKQNAVLMFNNDIQTNIFNNYTIEGSWITLISRYARRLADVESSENLYTIKSRFGNVPVSSKSTVRDSITNFINKVKAGELDAITDDPIINCFRTVEFGNTTSETLMSYQTARDKIIEEFMRDIGVKFANQKKAQVNNDEIQSDEQLLLVSLDDTLKTRKRGLEDFNKFFGTHTTVRINPKYDRSTFTKGGINNQSEEGDND